jgi:hypothetical protein
MSREVNELKVAMAKKRVPPIVGVLFYTFYPVSSFNFFKLSNFKL